MKTKQVLTAGALALSMILSGGMLTGCSNQTSTQPASTKVESKKTEKKITLGTKAEDSKSVKITNKTGKVLTVVETKSSSEENFSDNLFGEGESLKNKKSATLYYELKENDKLDIKVGLQDEDTSYVFKEVDTTDVKDIDVSLKEDKANLDVIKKDGSTSTLEPSEDTAKTEEEKKDEEEVKTADTESKKEESKQETASTSKKEDSSNKTTASTSKKENTTATANKNNSSSSSSNSGSSNKTNTGSSSNTASTKPEEHKHNWVAVTKTVHHDAEYGTRYVVDTPAQDVQIPQYAYQERSICNQCGADITNDPWGHLEASNGNCSGYHSEVKEVFLGYNTRHDPEVGHNEQYVVKEAYDETVTTGYKCSICGATK